MTSRRLPAIEVHYTSPRYGSAGFRNVATSGALTPSQEALLKILGVYPTDLLPSKGRLAVQSFNSLDTDHYVLSEIQLSMATDQWDRESVPYARHLVFQTEDLEEIGFDIFSLLARPDRLWSAFLDSEGRLPSKSIDYSPQLPARIPRNISSTQLASLIERLLDAQTSAQCAIVASEPSDVLDLLALAWVAIPPASRKFSSFHTLLDGTVTYEAHWQFVGCRVGGNLTSAAAEINLTSGSIPAVQTRYARDSAERLLHGSMDAVRQRLQELEKLDAPLTTATIDKLLDLLEQPRSTAPQHQRPSVAPTTGARPFAPAQGPAQKVTPATPVPTPPPARPPAAPARPKSHPSSLSAPADTDDLVMELKVINVAEEALKGWPVRKHWWDFFYRESAGQKRAINHLLTKLQSLYTDADSIADSRALLFLVALMRGDQATNWNQILRNHLSLPALAVKPLDQELQIAAAIFACTDINAIPGEIADLCQYLNEANDELKLGALALVELAFMRSDPHNALSLVAISLCLDMPNITDDLLVRYFIWLLGKCPDGKPLADAMSILKQRGKLDAILDKLFSAFAERADMRAKALVDALLKWREVNDTVSFTKLIQAFRRLY